MCGTFGRSTKPVADLTALSLADVRRFFADFYGSSDGELSVIGDFDPKDITATASERFGGWQSPRLFTRVAETFHDVAPMTQSFETPDKANAFLVAGSNVNLRDDDPDYAALVLGNYMLGGGLSNSRLATRIRQQEKGSATVSPRSCRSARSTGAASSRCVPSMRCGTPRDSRRRSRKRDRQSADRRLLAEEVEAAKAGWLQGRQVGRAQDSELAARLAALLLCMRTERSRGTRQSMRASKRSRPLTCVRRSGGVSTSRR